MAFQEEQLLADPVWSKDATPMKIGQSEGDSFLKFIDRVKSILCPNADESEDTVHSPPWSWIAPRILTTCVKYSSGVTPAILLSELSMAWNEHNRSGAPKKQSDCIAKLKNNRRKRLKLANTTTIDSIYEKRFLSLNSVIEAVIVDAFILPGTDIYMLTLGDVWSSNTIDLYLHKRFYSIADLKNGILRKGREVLLTGCYLRVTAEKSFSARLLPTEYFVVLLDEDEDDDAMLIGAQFCSDSFSSVCLDSVREGASYSLYARIERIGRLEVQGTNGNLQRKQITLVDNDGIALKFLLWGEQVLLANLLSVGSMLAIDRPFIASSMDSSLGTSSEICLEYGSATQLYLVPFLLHKEQVSVALTQNHYQGSRLSASKLTQGLAVSQVTLPCDSQGTIDFSNYPFQSYAVDLHDKMTGISLYGVVTDIRASGGIFSLKIEDTTGAIWIRLHFVRYWSLGRLTIGHIIYIAGLNTSLTPQKSLELSWHENDTGSSFFNLSCLPAFLNSSCLHRLLPLSDLSIHTCGVQVCRVWLDHVDHCDVDTTFMHTPCGHLIDTAPHGDIECRFCHRNGTNDVQRTFRLKITLADDTAKVLAWCIGQTASELLQISPDEFYELPEEEQIMYPSSLEHEKFLVAIASSRRGDHTSSTIDWEITLALKCE